VRRRVQLGPSRNGGCACTRHGSGHAQGMQLMGDLDRIWEASKLRAAGGRRPPGRRRPCLPVGGLWPPISGGCYHHRKEESRWGQGAALGRPRSLVLVTIIADTPGKYNRSVAPLHTLTVQINGLFPGVRPTDQNVQVKLCSADNVTGTATHPILYLLVHTDRLI
jgi:hypothetical protein